MPFSIRPGIDSDVHAIAVMLREFAEAEGRPGPVTATEEELQATLFGEDPVAEVLMAVDDDGDAMGYALFYSTFVPYSARHGIFLKNLFIRSRAQRRGLGTALLRQVAHLARDRECARLEWDALLDNECAQHFYARLGVDPFEVRPCYRVADDELTALADRKSPSDSQPLRTPRRQ